MKYCEEFAALLDPYVDGELTGEESACVRAHLEGCPGCRSYVDQALAIRAAFPEAEETVVPEGFADGVMAAVRAMENAKAAKRRTVYWKKMLLPLAACFAIVLAVRHGPVRGGGSTSAASNSAPAAMDTAAHSGRADNACAAEIPAEAAPQMEAGPEEDGLEAAPAPRITADEPAASVDGVPYVNGVEELENTVMTTSGGQMSAPRAVRLTAGQAGELLADLPCTTGEDGVRCYRLTGGEFDALLEALAERDILPQEEEFLAVETVPEGYHLVYVTEE